MTKPMTPVKAWAVLENGRLRDTTDIENTHAEASYLAAYMQRFDNAKVSIVRVEIRELPRKAKR